MLKLGHIEYSNCFPIHARLVDRGVPDGIALVRGVPSELNARLHAGTIDVAPSSSIEYPRHAERYRILPDLVIGSDGPVGSILVEAERPLDSLDGRPVAVPTASATSVVLLRLLFEQRLGIRPAYHPFDQSADVDPIDQGAAAALWIGDVALRRAARPRRALHDLGVLWTDWTGLPFAFAVWQVAAAPERDAELRALHRLLLESREYFEAHVDALAARHASAFGVSAERLARYWRSLEYRLDERMERGVLHFYRLAAEIGAAPPVQRLRWLTP